MKLKSSFGPIRNFFQGLLLLLGLLAMALVSAVTTMQFAIHGAEVKVPPLKDMTVAEARSQTSGLGLNLEVDNRYYSADVAAGHILSQAPAPGSVVRREWRVRVAESLGPQKVEVPSVLGEPDRTAALNLRRVGLEAGTIAHLPWPNTRESVEAGTVLAQDPPPRAQGIAQPSIHLLIAAADDTTEDGFVMPDLTGLPVVSAQSALTRVGIRVGPPRFETVALSPVSAPGDAAGPAKSTTLPGTVTGQQPPPGSRIAVGSMVSLTVAK